jgi:apolipoprotein D and lipocalin family protein
MKYTIISYLVAGTFILGACNPLDTRPSGNIKVPQPAKPVELSRYLGKWYEQGRYDASFQQGCEGVTAEYASKEDGTVAVVNTCREGSATGTMRTASATARVVEGSNGAKLKVSFFQPFEGDYWVLDRAPDYSWSIVGEPSGKYLWILTRRQQIGQQEYGRLVSRAGSLGYDTTLLRRTSHGG